MEWMLQKVKEGMLSEMKDVDIDENDAEMVVDEIIEKVVWQLFN